MDIGQGLAMFGQSIGEAADKYHKEHVQYDQQYQLAEALSRMAIGPQGNITQIDPQNPDKSLTPIIDKKALAQFQTANHQQMVKSAGALEALNRIATHTLAQVAGPIGQAELQQKQAAAALAQRAVDQPMGRLSTGELIVNTPHGASVQGGGSRGAATLAAEAGRAARFQATQALKARKDLLGQFNTQFGQYAEHPTDFLSPNIQTGVYDEKKKQFTPTTPNDATFARIGDQGVPIPIQTFLQGQKLATDYQKLGQIGYGGLTGGAQTEPVKVNTPEEARKLAPGTIYETPNGDQYQVPPK